MSYLTDEKRNKLSAELYEKYGKPLEAKHWGEYLAVSPDSGRTLLAPTLNEAIANSAKAFGIGNFIYKIGPRFVATALCLHA